MTSACVTSPAAGTVLASRGATFTVEGYAANGGARVRVEAKNGASWVEFDEFFADEDPIPWDDRLYQFSGSTRVPEEYWTIIGGEFGSGATIRFIEEKPAGGNLTPSPLKTFSSSGLTCLYNEIGQGEDFIVAGNDCHTGTTISLGAP